MRRGPTSVPPRIDDATFSNNFTKKAYVLPCFRRVLAAIGVFRGGRGGGGGQGPTQGPNRSVGPGPPEEAGVIEHQAGGVERQFGGEVVIDILVAVTVGGEAGITLLQWPGR